MKYSVLSVALLCLISISYIVGKKVPIYKVHYFNENNIILDGVPSDDIWGKSRALKDFKLPWDDKTPPVTIFWALYNSNNLYIFYKAEDQNLVIKDSLYNEIDIASEDRVELFLSKDKTMDEYFCIEIDPLGRVLDYRASYYREFDDQWNADGLMVGSKIFPESYQVEVAIPLNSLTEMGIAISANFYVGLFRADLENTISGIKENWLSWIDPKILDPDFHVPAALGIFHFAKK